MPPDISVVIPTCRRPAELAEAIRSVLVEKSLSLEVIVVDDTAEQSARPTIAGFSDPRIRYEVNPKPSGGWVSAVRNYGASFVRAPLVHFLDDDDRVPLGHYAAAKSAFAMYPDVGVIFGRVSPFGDDDASLKKEIVFFSRAARRAALAAHLGKRWAFSTSLYFGETLFVCGAAMIRKECFDAIGGFDPSLKVAEDVELYARAIARYGAKFIDSDALHYRIWNSSLMHTPTILPTLVRDNYRRIHARYRKDHGSVDYLARKAFTRIFSRLV
jgi:GT2 family glycosyltransferase